MESWILAFVGLAIVCFAAISQKIQKTVLTPPMVFVFCGLLAGPLMLGIVDLEIESSTVQILAEITLIILLFTDAVRIDLKRLRRERSIPVRLLLVGMPLTIALGTGIGMLIFNQFFFWEAAILATILAPTDAALGQAVVSNKSVPLRIRQALNVESGLNDGIVLPLILMMLAVACSASGIVPEDYTGSAITYWLIFASKQLILGPVVGAVVGFGGAKLLGTANEKGWSTSSFQALSTVGLALLAYASAELIHGNGFISAFVAGLVVGNNAPRIAERLYEFGEAEGQLLSLLTFLVFGALMVPMTIEYLNSQMVLYAVLSLTVIRMVPVAISLIGMRLRQHTVLFVGWFGPRGLASILFALLVIENSDLPNAPLIIPVVMLTVLVSIFAHGLTAFPLATRYGRWVENSCPIKSAAELEKVPDIPVGITHQA